MTTLAEGRNMIDFWDSLRQWPCWRFKTSSILRHGIWQSIVIENPFIVYDISDSQFRCSFDFYWMLSDFEFLNDWIDYLKTQNESNRWSGDGGSLVGHQIFTLARPLLTYKVMGHIFWPWGRLVWLADCWRTEKYGLKWSPMINQAIFAK